MEVPRHSALLTAPIPSTAVPLASGPVFMGTFMPIPIFIIDAFSDRPFGGNPAAVCILRQTIDAGRMQRIAAEMNLSETAFLTPLQGDVWALRWFTPTVEVDLCGHATLAAAHVLWHEQRNGSEQLTFKTRSGDLKVNREDDLIRLNFPTDPVVETAITAELNAILGTTPIYAGNSREDLLLVAPNAATVREYTPDPQKIAGLPVRGMILTAQSDSSDYDFISRFFAPSYGIAEDPVTGSAHCSLAFYWSQILGKKQLTGYQASARGGRVDVELAEERVYISGRATTVLCGELHA